MSFAKILDQLPAQSPLVRRFAALLAPVDDARLEAMAQEARALTRQNFGRTMRMFAPLYLSNECINNCRYCGFSRDNPILRITLSVEQVLAEGRHLAAQGFRQVLLVAGEHPKFVSGSYLSDCIRALAPAFSVDLARARPDGDGRNTSRSSRPARKGWSFTRRPTIAVSTRRCTPPGRSGISTGGSIARSAPTRLVSGGSGSGRCLASRAWRPEALALAAHLEYLLKHCWQSDLTVSLPRLRPAAGEFVPPFSLGDRELAQLICAFRICFPQVGIVLSTREPAPLRDVLASLGVTSMSSGSHTEPGGYTGQGRGAVHQTVRGRILPPDESADALATGQFEISDERSPAEVADCPASGRLRAGLERLGPGAGCEMKIFLNGAAADCEDATVEKLIARHGLLPETTLVERNGLALRRSEWAAQKLEEGDRLEILRVAAGG